MRRRVRIRMKESFVKKHWTCVVVAPALVAALPSVGADESKKDETKKDKAVQKRAAIDAMEKEALERLFHEYPGSKSLYEQASGYAVFDNLKVSLGISGGNGSGVAVERAGGTRTYMNMGQGGVGLGLGAKKYQVVFLFEKQELFDRFVNSGWQADASASAAAGTSGAGAAATFTDGMAIYQMTEKGLVAQADVSGVKYWKAKDLN